MPQYSRTDIALCETLDTKEQIRDCLHKLQIEDVWAFLFLMAIAIMLVAWNHWKNK